MRHSFYEEKTTVSRVEAVTLRVDTGEVISHEEMVHADEASAWQFCSRSSHQNGTVEFVDDLSRYSLGEKEHSGKELFSYIKNVLNSDEYRQQAVTQFNGISGGSAGHLSGYL